MQDRQRLQLIPTRFASSTSILTLPTTSGQLQTGAQTWMVGGRQFGAGGGTLGYLATSSDSGGSNGVRLLCTSSPPCLTFGASSSGSSANPYKQSAGNVFAYGDYFDFAGTWNGGLLAIGIHIYGGTNGAPMQEYTTGIASADGSGSILTTNNGVTIGNRPGAARYLNGEVYYSARWNRILSIAELRDVQCNGPTAVRDGLIFCWMNGRDWGPFGLNQSSAVAITPGNPSPFAPVVKVGRRRYMAADVAAATFQPAWAVSANAVIQAGARAA